MSYKNECGFFVASSPIDDGEKQNKRFRLTSKSSSKENSPTILPGKEQDFSIYKEKFIPPELSIWDYFIAKVFFYVVGNKTCPIIPWQMENLSVSSFFKLLHLQTIIFSNNILISAEIIRINLAFLNVYIL